MLGTIIGAVVTALLSGLIGWWQKKKQDELNIQNAVNIATQQAMLVSTQQAQAVQAQMNAGAATVPAITDMASAQAAFAVIKPPLMLPAPAGTISAAQKSMQPQRAIILHPDRAREMAKFKGGAALLLICVLVGLTGCSRPHIPTAGVVAQYPVINNPAPPEAMFANPETPLSDREKAGMTWSATLYKRVTIYNEFAEKSNANNHYYSAVAPDVVEKRSRGVASVTQARRMFE